MDTAKTKPVEIDDFGGMATSIDTHERPPGVSVEQVNVTCIQPGQLTCRGGLRVVQFDN